MAKRSLEARFFVPQPDRAVLQILTVLSFLVMGLLISVSLAAGADFTPAAAVSVDRAPACGLAYARTHVTDLVHNHPPGSCPDGCCCNAACYAAVGLRAVTLVFPSVADPGHFFGAGAARNGAAAVDAFRPPIA
jgi:hypothetical protein